MFMCGVADISVNRSDETREGRDFSSRAPIIEFDPFPHRHFDSTSSFAKKRGFPHPPPLFPSRSSRCSLSLLVVTPPPSTSSPSPILLPLLPHLFPRRGFPPLPPSPSPSPALPPFLEEADVFFFPGAAL